MTTSYSDLHCRTSQQEHQAPLFQTSDLHKRHTASAKSCNLNSTGAAEKLSSTSVGKECTGGTRRTNIQGPIQAGYTCTQACATQTDPQLR